MLRRLLGSAIIVATAAVALAGPQTYAKKVQTIRAGVVILDSAKPSGATYGRSAAPYSWYMLDRATNIKPASWNIVNPNGATFVTQSLADRWAEIGGVTYATVLSQKLGKRNAAYWEVNLRTVNDPALARYDVLLLNPAYAASLNPTEREKLRRFVDRGGVLWIDTAALGTGGIDLANNFPVAVQNTALGGGANALFDFDSPLFNGATTLNNADFFALGQLSGNNLAAVSIGAFSSNYVGLSAEFYGLRQVALRGGQPNVSVGRIGDGYVVYTGSSYSAALNGNAGVGFVAQPDSGFNGSTNAAAKFAVNVISLANNYRQSGGGSRQTSGTPIDIGAPLASRFRAESGPGQVTGTNASSVVYKGMVVASAGDHIVCFDASPSRDLDGDGDPDDGARDLSIGQSYDRIWSSTTMPTPISAPACTEVYYQGASGSGWMDIVVVVDGSGALHAFNLTRRDANRRLLGTDQASLYTIAAPNGNSSVVNGRMNPPTIDGGLAIMADSTGGSSEGRVWVADLSTGSVITSNSAWRVGGGGTTNALPTLTSGATVGYVPIQDNAGGVDRIVYAPGTVTNASTTTPVIVSLWLGAKGEKSSVDYDDATKTLTLTTRAAGSGGGAPIYFPSGGSAVSTMLAPRLSVVDANGDPLTAAQMAGLISSGPSQSSNGVLTYVLNSSASDALVKSYTFRLDYTIDWGNDVANNIQSVDRGRLQLPVPVGGSRRILGSLALSPLGTLYAVVGNVDNNGVPAAGAYGEFYALREDAGRGNFRVINRWSIYPSHSMVTGGAASNAVPPVLEDNDPITDLPGLSNLLKGELKELAFAGGPSLSGDQVFVPIFAKKANSVQETVTILLAFQAEPASAEFVVGDLPENFQILQPDFARTNPANVKKPDVYSTFGTGSYIYDRDSGIVRFDNLSRNTRGQVADCLSVSQPVIVRAAGLPDKVIQPDAIGGKWNTLLWYTVFQGLVNSTTPLATGNTVFVGGKSVVPSLLSVGSLSDKGLIYALDTDVASDTDWTIPTAGRPWLKQMVHLKFNVQPGYNPGAPMDLANWAFISIEANEHVRMPQAFGVSTLEDYVQRLLQSVAGNSTSIGSLAGGEGTLSIVGNNGLYGFDRADFVVCDEGRVARFDSSGNPIYSSDVFADNGQGGGAALAKPIVRATKAYPINQSDLLVVDTGGNRVFITGQSGVERRSIDGFSIDASHPPIGWQANASTSLNGPRDAMTYSEYRYRPASGDELSGQSAVEYWTHYVIADTGNRRLLDIVDRYEVDASGLVGPLRQVDGVAQSGILYWQSPPAMSGKDFPYISVVRVWLPDSSANGGRYVFVAGLGGSLPSRFDAGYGLDTPTPTTPVIRDERSGNGGVVVYDPASPAGTLVYNQIAMPSLSNTAFRDWANNAWVKTPSPASIRRFGNVTSVTATAVMGGSSSALLAIMVADSTGVYESVVDTLAVPSSGDLAANPNAIATLPSPRWMINREAYTAMRWNGRDASAPSLDNPLQFRPTYARRMDSGEVLIVNNYYGQTRRANSNYKGQVVLLNGDSNSDPRSGAFGLDKTNLGFFNLSIRYEIKANVPFRDVVNPVFADRR